MPRINKDKAIKMLRERIEELEAELDELRMKSMLEEVGNELLNDDEELTSDEMEKYFGNA